MKGLNFWQWLGVALLVLGLVLYLRKPANQGAGGDATGTLPPANTAPATTPSTQP